MRRLSSLTLRFATAASLMILTAYAKRANADVTLYDKDGWSFHTTGLIAAHYQLVKGDADPNGGGKSLAGGRILDEQSASDQRDQTITLSNIRTGFIGAQIGFGVNRKISENVHVESFLAISMNGINSNRGQNLQKDVDYREAWAAVVTPYGTVKFGRMFGLFASGSAEVVVMAYRYGVGNPCVINNATIACGSVGAGPLYAGFDGAIRYSTPRAAGLQFQLSIVDPSVGPGMKMSPIPRVDAEINFDQTFGSARLRVFGQTMFDRIGKSTPPETDMTGAITAGTITWNTVWGAMGTAILNVGGLALGGGAWQGEGIGERIPMEANDPANPLSYDGSLTLRLFRGFFGNVQYDFHGTALTVGGGKLLVRPTDLDNSNPPPNFVLADQSEYHATLSHKIDAIVLNAEFMRWHTNWHKDPNLAADARNPNQQTVNFMGVGINYLW
jgi:predicted porin